jgi:K(+)-stimulated pyrophosphate-energized sodium pump
MIGNCDLSKCATMTKEECAKMCDENGCTPEQKEMCMMHYDTNGKFIPTSKVSKKEIIVEIIKENGKSKATVTTTENGNKKIEIFEGSPELVKAKVEALK